MAKVDADDIQGAQPIQGPAGGTQEHLVRRPRNLSLGTQDLVLGSGGLGESLGLSHPWLIYYDAKIRLQGGGKQS